ncbi:AraC family transcriptional regulator [Erwiniaceae bacterium BAC15a-03b]|uniref:Arabinose operon regulatory protein n=1 Tax=Winslowiella arboricola TaxID=2978220 RepID=A0A9J6PLE9_9GAMM|nr:AraC family transcriptional regulator [Winslowiella arboricola]MCU5773251.1 AraC family transcriptional regulator [Winslowiella arboricola]MCU5779137.1 AraC family transcriptional regulator [Winslowiella arboricola]
MQQQQVRYYHPAEMPGMVLGEARFSDFNFAPHYHLDYHIGVIRDGVQRQRFAGSSQLLAAGRISIMPPGEVHTGTREGEHAYTLYTFRVKPQLLQSLADEIAGKTVELRFGGAILTAPGLSRFLQQLHQQSTRQPLVDEHYLNALEPLLTQLKTLQPQQLKGGLSDRDFRRVRDYCYDNISENLALPQLAALCDMSRFQFLRRFSQRVGMTPHAWLLRLRLEIACQRLNRGDSPIAQVAAAVGFYDQSHFNRAFRQAFGVAPSAY